VLSAANVAEELLAFAGNQNATRLMMGSRPVWAGSAGCSAHRRRDRTATQARLATRRRSERGRFVRGGFADQLARTKAYLGIDESKAASSKLRWPGYAAAAVICGVATAFAWLLFGRFEATNLVMVYLVGVLIVAYRFGRGPAIAASVLSVAL
jgi:two-component system sensor histidine kinase KdpD